MENMNHVPYNIFLIGFMGAGKTTVSASLAKRLNMDCVETDQLIVDKMKMSINDIFAQYGEPYFRDIESNTLIELQQRGGTVVSCGGGIAMRPENSKHMKKNGRVVLLAVSPEAVYDHIKGSTDRPVLKGHMNIPYIAELMEKRRPYYEATADITVLTDQKTVSEICDEIIAKLG
ncbi:MAG: shikimate kinase [Clostridiales bacterium]|nr:shikimate kinase [Clostridiales bacterium]